MHKNAQKADGSPAVGYGSVGGLAQQKCTILHNRKKSPGKRQ
jgi:hypothetical protein